MLEERAQGSGLRKQQMEARRAIAELVEDEIGYRRRELALVR